MKKLIGFIVIAILVSCGTTPQKEEQKSFDFRQVNWNTNPAQVLNSESPLEAKMYDDDPILQMLKEVLILKNTFLN